MSFFNRSNRRLPALFRPWAGIFFISLLLMMVDALMQLAIPLLFREVLNALQSDAQAFIDEKLSTIILLAIGATLIFFPAAYFGHSLGCKAIIRFITRTRARLFEHVQGLCIHFFHRNRVGEISTRLSSDLEGIEVALYTLCGMAWTIIAASVSITFMFIIDERLAMGCLSLIALISLVTHFALPKLKELSRNKRDMQGNVTALITEMITINPLIRSLAKEEKVQEKLNNQNDLIQKKSERLIAWQLIYNDSMQVIMKLLAPFFLLLVGAVYVAKGDLMIGDLVAFWGFWMILAGATQMFFNNLSIFFIGLSAADRVEDFFAQAPTVKDPEHPKVPGKREGRLEFNNVFFSYPEEKDETLKNLELKIEPGQHVAIVGPSGSGKSTLLLLLMRFYDPKEGSVHLDGVDLKDMKQRDLRERVGMIFQESQFFAGSIRENLLLAKPSATEKECWEALEQAGAASFIAGMDHGLDSTLGEHGLKLSGGQKQRLAIARVFLKDPDILLMDEATSALDAISEAHIQKTLDKLLQGRTCITVAHRMKTVQGADEILVLEDGQLIDRGNHHSLMESNDLYRSFCKEQFIA